MGLRHNGTDQIGTGASAKAVFSYSSAISVISFLLTRAREEERGSCTRVCALAHAYMRRNNGTVGTAGAENASHGPAKAEIARAIRSSSDGTRRHWTTLSRPRAGP